MFTAAEIREIKQKIGASNPSRFFGKDWYKWFHLNQNGRVDAVEVSNTGAQTVAAGGLDIVTFDTVVKDEDNLFDDVDGVLIKNDGFYTVTAWGQWSSGSTTNPFRTTYIRGLVDGVQTIIDQADMQPIEHFGLNGTRFLRAGNEVNVRALNADSVSHDVTVHYMTVVRVG